MDGECCTYCNCRKGHRTRLSAVDLFSKPFYSSPTLASERLQFPPNLAKLWHWHTPLGRVPTEHIHTTFHQQLSILVSGSWKLMSVFSGICYGPGTLGNINNIYLSFQVFCCPQGFRKQKNPAWETIGNLKIFCTNHTYHHWRILTWTRTPWFYRSNSAPSSIRTQIYMIRSNILAVSWSNQIILVPGPDPAFWGVSEPLNVISNYNYIN